MHNNYILKQAVLAALTLLSVGLQNPVFAVGLGDIEVKSHIGQPLQAKLKVQGIVGLKDKACFRLGSDSDGVNPINNGNIRLSNIKGDEAILTISTTDAIIEPIVSLAVIAECDSNFRRDYVLLIDPLLTTELTSFNDAETTDGVEIINSVDEKSAVTQSPVTQTNYNQSVRVQQNSAKKSSASHKNSHSHPDLTLNNAQKSTASTQNKGILNPQNTTKNSVKSDKPRLSISGGTFDSHFNSLGLRLDKQLRFAVETSPQALANHVAIADEATVLGNRLAHLEQQITTLQQRNRALEAEKNAAIKPQAEKLTVANSANSTTNWWPYLAGIGLLIGGYFAADFWRRRRQSQQLDNAEDVWNALDANSSNIVYYKDIDLEDTLFEDKPLAAAKTAEQTNSSAAFAATSALEETPFQIEEDNFEHNILDHADVFLSHGRTSLAIQLLQNHLLDFPKQSVTIWLFLLDLVAKENLQAVYEQTALECKEHFNIKIADFAAEDKTSSGGSLESYSRLANGLQQIWGTPAALVYLDDLIYNSRLEVRVGFEKNVIEELVLLRGIALSNVSTADIIQLDEKKMAIKELKEAKIEAMKATKLQKIEALTMTDVEKVETVSPEKHEELFEFNLVEYK